MIMGNTIVIMILIAVAALALLRTRKHFKGGGCCGSGSNTIRTQKKLTGTVIGQKTLTIEGMHCENCQARIENAINRIDGVACQVNLRKKAATVSYTLEISDDQLKAVVEKIGYRVTEIKHNS